MQTVATPSYRDAALQSLSRGDDDEFIGRATAYLAGAPDDAYLRLMVARSYLRLGLVGPARETLAEANRCGTSAEVAELSDKLAGLPSQSVPWSRLRPQFQQNLDALAARIDVQPLVQAWEEHAETLELFRDRRGQFQVRERNESGAWTWFPCLGDHAADDAGRPLPNDHRNLMPGPYVFEGLGLGGYFERVYRATLDTFLGFSCAILLVEPRLHRVAVAMHLRDWSSILADPRVLVFLGPACMDHLRAVWRGDWDLPLPHSVITGPIPAGARRAVHVIQAAAGERASRVRSSLEELNRLYAGKDVAYWAGRLDEAISGRGEPLRILAGVSTHTTFLQHSMRDARRALESLGHCVQVLTETAPYRIVGPLTYHHAIRESRPDLFFALDHFRPEFGAILPDNLPVLTWDQDSLPHVLTRNNLAGMAPHDFLVGCSKIRCMELGLRPEQSLYVRVPTCPEQFGGEPLTPEEEARYSCDVSYVSHASQTPGQFHEQERQACRDPAYARLIDAIYKALMPLLAQSPVADGFVMQAALDAALKAAGLSAIDEQVRTRLQGWYIWRLADRLFRHEALGWVAEWAARTGRSFRIYGNGWDRHPTLAPFAAGPAANGRELLCIYRASRINLQLMPGGFIHQRALDGLAAGGFFLTRYVPADLRGRTLRRLVRRIDELGVTGSDSLLAAADPELRALLGDYLGPHVAPAASCAADLLTALKVNAELTHPDEAFPDFEEIVFDSSQRFAHLADRFLADDDARARIAQAHRQTVLQRFSYTVAVDQFLKGMADYLGTRAGLHTRSRAGR